MSIASKGFFVPSGGIGQWFGHLSVGLKLSLGFGLVLLSTLAMALANLHALRVQQAASIEFRALDALQINLSEARQAEKDFGLTLAPEAAARVVGGLDRLPEGLARAGVTTAFQRELQQMLQRYRIAFDGYAASGRSVHEARMRMQTLAEVAGQRFAILFIDQLDSLNLSLEQAEPPSAGQMQQLEEVVNLRERLANLRDSELYFSLDPQKRFRDDWENRMSELVTALSSLSTRLDEAQRVGLDEAGQALAQYRQAFQDYALGGQAGVQAEGQMTAAAQQVTDLLEHERAQRAEADALTHHVLQIQLAILGVLTIGLGVGAALSIRLAIIAPLRHMLGLAQRVAAGDLSEMPVALPRRDELGQLSDAVRHMLDALRGLVGRIGSGVDQLDQAADALASMVERTGDGVRAQRQQADWVAGAMQRMTRSAAVVSEQVTQSCEALAEAGALALDGDGLVRRASDSLQRLSVEMVTSVESMRGLQGQSESIHRVLDVINALAEQTNLLALNAAIEAARAGDHGRGFAVVADEVRALASRTRDSTGEIEAMIRRLGELTLETADSLQGSQLFTAQGVELTGQASAVLATITIAMERAEVTGRSIDEASTAQYLMARQVDEAVEQVARVVEQNAQDCQHLQAASDNLQQIGVSLGHSVGSLRCPPQREPLRT